MDGSILIVDDEHVLLKMIANILGKNYSCDTADEVASAMDMIKNNDYHIILTDKNMISADGSHDEGGLEILEFAKKYDPSVEVIMMTGYASAESAVKALQLGAFDYIFKPFNIKDLIEKIEFIRKCQNLFNSEDIAGFYKSLNIDLITFLDSEYHIAIEQQDPLHKFLNDRIGFIIKTIKTLERIVIDQRENMAVIASKTDEFIDNNPEPGPHLVLAKEILDLASRRV